MQEKRKILFVITKGNFGGAQRYVFDLATNLPKSDFDVVVACGAGGLLIEKLKEASIKAVEIEGLVRDVNFKDDFRTFVKLIKIIKEEKPNVVHLNSSKIGFLGSLVILYFRISYFITRNSCPVPRSIFTAHGWAFNEKGRSSFSRLIYYLGHYLTILFCNTTIAVSEKTKKDILFLPFVNTKIRLIHNGILDFNLLPREESRTILADENRHKIIIFSISELHKNKGIDLAIRALSLLSKEIKEKIVYSIAGDGEERENLEKLTKELKVERLIKFLGFVPDARKLLSGCDIFLLPSRTEAFPYATLEAGLAGSPIIATNVGGIPEIISDMQNGVLVHPHNPKEITEAITYLINHSEKKERFGTEIRKTVKNSFSLEKMLSETIEIYSQ